MPTENAHLQTKMPYPSKKQLSSLWNHLNMQPTVEKEFFITQPLETV